MCCPSSYEFFIHLCLSPLDAGVQLFFACVGNKKFCSSASSHKRQCGIEPVYVYAQSVLGRVQSLLACI